MGFFQSLKDDLSEAVNELMEEENAAAEKGMEEPDDGLPADMDINEMLKSIEDEMSGFVEETVKEEEKKTAPSTVDEAEEAVMAALKAEMASLDKKADREEEPAAVNAEQEIEAELKEEDISADAEADELLKALDDIVPEEKAAAPEPGKKVPVQKSIEEMLRDIQQQEAEMAAMMGTAVKEENKEPEKADINEDENEPGEAALNEEKTAEPEIKTETALSAEDEASRIIEEAEKKAVSEVTAEAGAGAAEIAEAEPATAETEAEATAMKAEELKTEAVHETLKEAADDLSAETVAEKEAGADVPVDPVASAEAAAKEAVAAEAAESAPVKKRRTPARSRVASQKKAAEAEQLSLKDTIKPAKAKKGMEGLVQRAVTDETAVISEGMTIRGNIFADGNMDVGGVIEGNVDIAGKLNISGVLNGDCVASEVYADGAEINGDIRSFGSVKVGQSTVIIGDVFAASAVIAGAIKGDIDVKGPVILDSAAIVMGNIRSQSVQISNGAVIEGMCSQVYAEVSPASFFEEYKKSSEKALIG
ncbi:MAG: polymer-forming cytoskeletal protein [Lachnospiraceae bacterium]|nr:polymer-forming cytoskeletal protein [Lachnospiraceae bacterium]